MRKAIQQNRLHEERIVLVINPFNSLKHLSPHRSGSG